MNVGVICRQSTLSREGNDQMHSASNIRLKTEVDTECRSGVDYIIDIVSLRKSFNRHSQSSYTTIKSYLLSLLSGKNKERQRADVITVAIDDLTMRIPKGASIGLIGRNGSGKSTFLKLLTGIYKPTAGHVTVNGTIAALIELGAGFHPDFTGRENLFLAGAMHGLSRREIEDTFDDIVDFAELRQVIDEPVRTYSSGMFMRLGFSIAVHTNPDVLLIDEVLAVGDAGFVAKCKDKIGQLQKQGKTLVMVTHDLDSVERWCDEAIWLDKGVVKDRGHPRRVIDAYRSFVEKEEERVLLQNESAPAESDQPLIEEATEDSTGERWGSREIEVLGVEVGTDKNRLARVIHPDDGLRIEIQFIVNDMTKDLRDIVFGVALTRADGLQVFGSNTDIDKVEFATPSKSGRVLFEVDRIGLVDGNYTVDVAVHSVTGYPFDYHKGIVQFSVRSDGKTVGVYSPQRSWTVTSEGSKV